MADDHRRRADLSDELADQRVDLRRADGVELARRLVGYEQLRLVRERRTDRNALLLAAGELARERVAAVEQADALEKAVGDALALRAAHAEKRGASG